MRAWRASYGLTNRSPQFITALSMGPTAKPYLPNGAFASGPRGRGRTPSAARLEGREVRRHGATISVRYLGSSAARSLRFSATSLSLAFGGGDVRLSTGKPTAINNSSCPAGAHG